MGTLRIYDGDTIEDLDYVQNIRHIFLKYKNKSGIYCIQSKINQKIYIGQAEDIYKRITGYLCNFRTKKPNGKSYKLIAHAKKYGIRDLNFSVIILCNKIELNFWEKFWIKSLGSLEYGFNLTAGGENIFERHKKRCILKNIITGEIVDFPSIKEFCKSQKWDESSGVGELLRGGYKRWKDWILPETDILDVIRTYIFLDPNGNKVITNSLNRLAKQNGLSQGNLRMVYTEKRPFHKGWRKYKKELDGIPFQEKTYRFVNPEGVLIEGKSLIGISRKYNISYTGLRSAFFKNRNHCGWRKYKSDKDLVPFYIYKYNIIYNNKSYETYNLNQFSKDHNLTSLNIYNYIGIKEQGKRSKNLFIKKEKVVYGS